MLGLAGGLLLCSLALVAFVADYAHPHHLSADHLPPAVVAAPAAPDPYAALPPAGQALITSVATPPPAQPAARPTPAARSTATPAPPPPATPKPRRRRD